MIERTPPGKMTTEERLGEIARLLMRACARLHEKAKAEKKSLSHYLTTQQKEKERNSYL